MEEIRKLSKNHSYVKSSIFGIEDSLVSTTGVIAGIAVASGDQEIILVAGLVTIVVEAVSMAAGEFISEEARIEMTPRSKTSSILSGVIMFISYFIAGFIPLLPILLFPLPQSVLYSVGFAFIGLFALGLMMGKLTKASLLKSGLKVMLVGGVATILGVIVGMIFKI